MNQRQRGFLLALLLLPAAVLSLIVANGAGQAAVASPLACVETVQNGGFEEGLVSGQPPGWTQANTGDYDIVVNAADLPPDLPPHSGDWEAVFGGDVDLHQELYQAVLIPANAVTATLTYYWFVPDGNDPVDTLEIRLRNVNGADLEALQTIHGDTEPVGAWNLSTFDVSAYRGQTVQIYFKVTTTADTFSIFMIDDVSLLACAPQLTPAPTMTRTATITATQIVSTTATVTGTPSSTPVASPSATASVTATLAASPTLSATSTTTATSSPSASATSTVTTTMTTTPSPSMTSTATPSRTATATQTALPSATVTLTTSPTTRPASATPSPSATATATAGLAHRIYLPFLGKTG